MRFSCESCGAQYMISDEKVGPNGVKVRCKKCGNVVSVKRAPAVAPEVAPAPPPPAPESRAEAGPETTLERELGNAFENVFGGGSPGLSAEARAAQAAGAEAPPPAAPDASNPAQNGVAAAEAIIDWYVAIDDSQVGPLPALGVKARWESGEIGPDTLSWRPGMADWVPLSTIPEMAQYLAPVPRGASKPAPAARPAAALEPRADAPRSGSAPVVATGPAPATPAAANGASNGAANGHDAGWKPSAASALAALASEEMASRQRPEPKKADPVSEPKGGSLLDRMDLPDGGVDPTNLVPLPIRGLDPTGESALKPKAPAPAGDRTEIRQIKKSATRSVVAMGVVMAVLFAAGIGVVAWLLRPAREVAPVPQPMAQAAPAPAPASPTPNPTPTATPPATASATAPATPPASAAPASATATAPVAAPPATATTPPPAEPVRAAAAPDREPPAAAPPAVASRPHRKPKAEPTPRPPRRSQRVAAADRPLERPAEPGAAPAPVQADPPRKKSGGDPLLDVGSDDDLEKELSGKGASKRSVYVPPAIGSDLPENVSVSQINEAVVGQKSALVRCIEQQKAADPDTRGTLKVRWIISGDGSVRDVRVVSDEFARQPIAPCISGVVKGIRFPRTRTTGQEVVFPFKF
jgi:predicted Zn finger-like uncharacterized protein